MAEHPPRMTPGGRWEVDARLLAPEDDESVQNRAATRIQKMWRAKSATTTDLATDASVSPQRRSRRSWTPNKMRRSSRCAGEDDGRV